MRKRKGGACKEMILTVINGFPVWYKNGEVPTWPLCGRMMMVFDVIEVVVNYRGHRCRCRCFCCVFVNGIEL